MNNQDDYPSFFDGIDDVVGDPESLSGALDQRIASQHQTDVYDETLFGKRQTRERQTEVDYTAIAMRLWGAYEKLVNQEEGGQVTPMGLAIWMIGRKPEWSKPTWRRYKSAVVYYLRSIVGDAEALLASDHLEAATSNGCKSETDASSAGRIKNVSRKEFMRFLSCFSDVYSKHHRFAGLAKTWMLLGSMTGLRPHEWGQAELLRNIPDDHELVLSGKLKGGGHYLRVKNSKHTNGRANGAFRHLDVSGLPVEFLAAMDSLIKILSDRVRYPTLYDNCRKFVADANKHFFGRNKGRRIHLYTSRHRFASEAKRTLPSDQVAAAMGHGSDQTAYSMYGTSRYSSGGVIAAPVESEAKTVKRKGRDREKPYAELAKTTNDQNSGAAG